MGSWRMPRKGSSYSPSYCFLEAGHPTPLLPSRIFPFPSLVNFVVFTQLSQLWFINGTQSLGPVTTWQWRFRVFNRSREQLQCAWLCNHSCMIPRPWKSSIRVPDIWSMPNSIAVPTLALHKLPRLKWWPQERRHWQTHRQMIKQAQAQWQQKTRGCYRAAAGTTATATTIWCSQSWCHLWSVWVEDRSVAAMITHTYI